MTTAQLPVPPAAPVRRRRLPVAVLAVAAALALLRGVVVEPVAVLSASMEPAVRSGATVLVDRVGWRLTGLDAGDVVVFASPQDGARTLKRVVAVGGQQVAIRDAVLHVDGRRVDEPGVDLSRVDGLWFGPVQVPPGTVFVLGDARAGSIDSRVFGAVPLDAVRGRVVWPLV